MLVATFKPGTGLDGQTITHDGQRFYQQDVGPITPQRVLQLDGLGQTEWAYDGLREWVSQVAAAPPAAQKGVGVGGFIWSLCGFVFPICWIVGLIVSRWSMKQAAREQVPGGLALAGFLISGLGLAVYLGIILFVLVLPAAG